VLVLSDGAGWAAYLSGIPSSRVDAVGTVVRYTLVLDGPCGAPDVACVTAAVAAWLDDIAGGHGDKPDGRLAAALDARFPAADVERWLAGSAHDTGHPVGDEVRRRTSAALAALSAPTSTPDEPGDWIGAIGAGEPRAAFVARVAALLGGAPGRALLLNLVGGPDDARPLLDPASPLAVLVESTDPQLARCTALRPVVEAKKAPAPPARGAGVVAVAGIAIMPLVVLFVLLATTAVMVTLLMWLL
jgi:hypothetical protein